MANSITITKTEYTQLLNRLADLEKAVAQFGKQLVTLFEKEPPYGSEIWWEWSDKKALHDIKSGRHTTYPSSNAYLKELDSRINNAKHV